MLEHWTRRYTDRPTPTPDPDRPQRRRWRQDLIEIYGTAEENPAFWASISPSSYVGDLSGPIQLHHGTADDSVPVEFSETLYAQIQQAGKPVELYTYKDDNHNISANFGTAMARSIQFFDRYVKGVNPTTE
jgi:dipeptidyl aminopeptidase/acylaminoacyl peptidase